MNLITKPTMEEVIRKKLEGLDYPFDPSDWARIEQDLPKKPGPKWTNPRTLAKFGGLGAGVAGLLILGVFLLRQPGDLPLVSEPTTATTQTLPETQTKPGVSRASLASPAANQGISKSQSVAAEPVTALSNPPKPGPEVATATGKSQNTDPLKQVSLIFPPSTPPVPVPVNPVSPVSFSASESEGCLPLGVRFRSGLQSDTLTFLWSFGDGETATGSEVYHFYKSAGVFTPVLKVVTSRSRHEIGSSSGTVVAKALPDAGFVYEQSQNRYIFSPRSKAYDKCTWSIPAAGPVSGDEPEVVFPKNGRYPVSLTVVGENGCVARTTAQISVQVEHVFHVPNAFTPDGDGRNDLFGAVGDGLDQLEFSLRIFDRNGVLVFSSTNPDQRWDGRISSSLRPAENGVYVWKIVTRDAYGNSQEKSGSLNLYRN